MARKRFRPRDYKLLSLGIALWLAAPLSAAHAEDAPPQETQHVQTEAVDVEAQAAQEEAKYESQQKTIITKEDIEKKQAKAVEDIIFSETGVSRTVDAMGRVGISIRGAEPRHTLILVDGQPVLGDLAKYSGAADEVMRLGTENVERIEIIQGAASAKYGSDAIGGVVNIITKKAQHEPGVQFNVESMRRADDDHTIPYTNFFLRADSGDMGKFRIGLSGSKREVMPVYASVHRKNATIPALQGAEWNKVKDWLPTALRYYGDTATVGLVGTYDANKNNSFEFRVDHYAEDLIRDVKRTDSDLEPQQHFKRKTDRNSYNLGWRGMNKISDWNVELNYTSINEDDVSLINYAGKTTYEGKNELRYVDDVDHSQFDLKASANTQLGDKHLISYGFGYTRESGEGSRLKNSPNTSTRNINAWDYDKSLLIEKQDRLIRGDDNKHYIWSHIHDYKFSGNEANGLPHWDIDYEYYYYDKNKAGSFLPGIDYEKYDKYLKGKTQVDERPSWYPPSWPWQAHWPDGSDMDDKDYKSYMELRDRLRSENPSYPSGANIVEEYFKRGKNQDANAPKLNGKAFLEEYWSRDQRITVGSGTIQRYNLFVGDTWQMSKNTIFSPILRLDHSSLFGTNISGNLGITHNIGGNPHRRFKANIGTGYTEPGMGELWYNWEMYGSNPVGIGVAKMGWWWEGNPELKPEKSFNIDMSIEGESKDTTARLGIFHNRIRDYMSVYFTGRYMDFAPQLGESSKWMRAPDMIYSFKNIGQAEITGLEAEVRHQLSPFWNVRLGYTWLHAINKSDPLMPDRLIDRPRHKIDIGFSYENKQYGWSGQIWGDYYIDMLDSNTLANSANYYPVEPNAAVNSNKVYQSKTFGIWNLMIQKQLSPDAMVYFGINNLFNHRDDDRATQERVYRFGANFKFDTAWKKKVRKAAGSPVALNETAEDEVPRLQGFLLKDFDESRKEGIEFFGDYQMRWNAHNGTNRPQSTYTENSSVSEAAQKNMLDADGHAFEQRVRVGASARLGEKTDLTVVGSLSGRGDVDTAQSLPDNKGLNEARLERAALTHKAKDWTFALGRIQEPMGVTGYWFGKEYDGVRAVYTNTAKDMQVRLGFGTFKHSTGVSDTAYTHVTNQSFYRPPTMVEFLGLDRDVTDSAHAADAGDQAYAAAKAAGDTAQTQNLYFYQQLKDAPTIADKMEVLKRMQSIVNQAYGSDLAKKTIPLSPPTFGSYVYYRIKDSHGNVKIKRTQVNFDGPDGETSEAGKAWARDMEKKFSIKPTDPDALQSDGSYFQKHSAEVESTYKELAEYRARENWRDYKFDSEGRPKSESLGEVWEMSSGRGKSSNDWVTKSDDYTFDGVVGTYSHQYEWSEPSPYKYKLTEVDVLKFFKEELYEKPSADAQNNYGLSNMSQMGYKYLEILDKIVSDAESGNALPRASLGNIVGNLIKTTGVVLEKDDIPPLDKAFYLQVKKELAPNLGVTAWYLRSVGDKSHTILAANGTGNDEHTFDQLANVIGVGAKWQIGKKTAVSFDYGQNRSAFGKYMNGHSTFDHPVRTDIFTPRGHQDGGVPTFWTARLDIGEADMDKPGTWNAFVDYKHFEHGSFFGGNGTDYLPDRYLDGIESFSIGGGYVPAKNWLLELFYTFDAKSTNQRDTLHGPESFKLGNYARAQITYRF